MTDLASTDLASTDLASSDVASSLDRRSGIAWVGAPPPATIDPDRRGSDPFLGRPGSLPPAGGESDVPVGREEAFRVELGSASPVLGVHFHRVTQFQYFVAGSGRFANHDVGPGLVHFTDAYTPYGPLLPGPGGVSFLTLRTVPELGALFMPESQAELVAARRGENPPRPHRNVTLDLASCPAGPGWTALAPALDAEDGSEDGSADGFAVWVTEVGAHEELSLPEIGEPGAYVLVVSGSIPGDAAAVGHLAFCRPPYSGRVLRAGAAGLRLGLLHFPLEAAAAAV